MASIERTAYPRFPRTLPLKDLQTTFMPRPEEIEWAHGFARAPDRRLTLLVNLKCFQFLRYFPPVDTIPEDVVGYVAASLGMPSARHITYPDTHTSPYRYHKAIRALLGVKPYVEAKTGAVAVGIAQRAAAVIPRPR